LGSKDSESRFEVKTPACSRCHKSFINGTTDRQK
jgi:hypothetical protein